MTKPKSKLNVGGMGTREGIELEWSLGFGLYELNV
jgi:hypothetical protein